jgi:hypothetical protein
VRISPPVIRPESMPSAEITSSFGCTGRRGHADGRTACGHCTTMAHISDESAPAQAVYQQFGFKPLVKRGK